MSRFIFMGRMERRSGLVADLGERCSGVDESFYQSVVRGADLEGAGSVTYYQTQSSAGVAQIMIGLKGGATGTGTSFVQ